MVEWREWRVLEARFRELQPKQGDGLRANWISTASEAPAWVESRPRDHWHFSESEDSRTIRIFTLLAERAAHYLGHHDGESALFFWLDLIKQNTPSFELGTGSYSPHREHGLRLVSQLGMIRRVCEVSADYCMKLENEMSLAPEGTPRDLMTTRSKAINLNSRECKILEVIERRLKGHTILSRIAKRRCEATTNLD